MGYRDRILLVDWHSLGVIVYGDRITLKKIFAKGYKRGYLSGPVVFGQDFGHLI